jgi:Zn-dependent protease
LTPSFWTQFIQLDHLLFRICAFLLAIMLHDLLQSGLALLLGDRTPREQGRLTANPLAHLDTVGTAMLLFGPYGWSRPIRLNGEALGAHSKLKSLAIYGSGIGLHLCLGILFWWLSFHIPFMAPEDWSSQVEGGYSSFQAWPSWSVDALKGFIYWSYIVNIMMFIMHLFPLYPTDMWRILSSFANGRWQKAAGKLQLISMLVLIAILVTPIGRLWLGELFQWWSSAVMHMF